MSQLWTIVRTEARLLRADGVARLAVVLFVAALAYAGWVGAVHVGALRSEVEAVTAAHAERLNALRQAVAAAEAKAVAEGVGPDVIHVRIQHPFMLGSSRGQVATLDPGPLAAFAFGQSDLLAHAVLVRSSGIDTPGEDVRVRSPFRLLVGPVDVAFVFLVLFPLLTLALGVGLTTAERESGQLRLMLARPLRLPTLALGKATVRAMLLLACAAVGVGMIWLAAGRPGGLGRPLLWLLVTALYGGFWLALAALVDSRVRRSATAAVVLAACWLGLAVVLPAGLAVAAETLFAVPSRTEYVAATRVAALQASRESEASLARFFGDHPELADSKAAGDFYTLRVARDARVAEALAPIEARFEQQRARQHRLVHTLGYLSPTILAQRAGTGPARYDAFAEQTQDFRASWAERYVPRYFAGTPLRAAEFDDIPTFDFKEEPPGQLLSRLAGPMGGLALAGILLGLAASRGYARSDAML